MFKTTAVQGLLQALMVRLYANIAEELGLAPGGEFRVAYTEVQPNVSWFDWFIKHKCK